MATIARLETIISASIQGFQNVQTTLQNTEKQLSGLAKSGQQLDKMTAGMSSVGKAAYESAQASNKLIAGMSAAGKAAADAAPKALTLSSAIGSMAGLVGGISLLSVGLNAVGGAVGAVVQQGLRLGPVRDSFESLTKGIGESADAMLSAQRSATKGLISDLDLMQASNKAILLGLPVTSEEMGKLAKTAVTLGRAMGQDATSSLDDLITALGRSSPMILDNLGLTVKLGEANEKYAKSIGKTADELTDAEKKMAFYKAALEAAEKKTNDLGEVQLTNIDRMKRYGTALMNTGASIVNWFNTSQFMTGPLRHMDDLMSLIGGETKPKASGPFIGPRMSTATGIVAGSGLPDVDEALQSARVAAEGLDKAYVKLMSDVANDRGMAQMNADLAVMNATASAATVSLQRLTMVAARINATLPSSSINPALAMMGPGAMPYGGNLFTFGSGVPLPGQGGGGGGFFGNLFGGAKSMLKGMTGGNGMSGLLSGLGSGLLTGGLSSLMGMGMSLVGKGIGALVGHFTQGKQTNDLRDQLFGGMGGAENVAKLAAEAGFSMDRLLQPSKVKDMQRAWEDFNKALEKHRELADNINQLADAHAQRQQMLQDALSRYNFTAQEKGPLINMQEMAAQAEQLLNDYKLLTESGVDQSAVLREMSGSMSDFVNRAIKTGTEVPEAMRSMIEQMIASGELLDENGVAFTSLEQAGIKFGESLTDMFKGVLTKLDELIEKLNQAIGSAQGLNNIASGITVGADEAAGAIPMAGGGAGLVTRPTLFLAGENGPEQYAFSGAGRSFGDGGLGGQIAGLRRDMKRALGTQLQLSIRDAVLLAR